MAAASSGLLVQVYLDVFDATQLAIDLSLSTHKVAMFTNTITNDLTSNTAYQYGVTPYDANEVSGTGYTAGGTTISSPTFTHSSGGLVTYDAADVSWASSTITNARAALLYADALASPADPGIVWVNFGGDYSTTSGTFTIQWAAGGIFNIDLIP